MFRRSSLLVFVGVLFSGLSAAQAQVPDSDIWVADLIPAGGGQPLRIGDPVNATNRAGYDNQPAFLYFLETAVDENGHAVVVDRMVQPKLGFLYTSADSLGSTDIYRWDPRTNSSVRVTQTPESEYSPTPFGSKSHGPAGFYAVRVEADSTQRLWKFNIDGSNPQVVLSDVDSVGYFAWIDESHVAMFVLGNEKKKEPHTLRVVDTKTGVERIVARDVGRSIQPIDGMGDISFTLRENDDHYRFLILKKGRTTGEPLMDTIASGQDASWMGNGTMLMSSGTTIYASRPLARGKNQSTAWQPVRDFADVGIIGITRLVVSPDQHSVAFVATHNAP